MSTPRLSLPLLAAAAGVTLLSGCSFEFSLGNAEPVGEEESPAAEEAPEVEEETEDGAEDGFADKGDWTMDLRLTYTSAESAEIGMHGLGVSPVSEDTASEFGSDGLYGYGAVCSGTPDLVAVAVVSDISEANVDVTVSADGTGSAHINQPDNADHPGWLSVSNGPDQHGTWSYADGVVTLTGVTMHTMANDGWGTLSGTIECEEDTVA